MTFTFELDDGWADPGASGHPLPGDAAFRSLLDQLEGLPSIGPEPENLCERARSLFRDRVRARSDPAWPRGSLRRAAAPLAQEEILCRIVRLLDRDEHESLVDAIGEYGGEQVAEALHKRLSDLSQKLRTAAIFALRTIGGETAALALASVASDPGHTQEERAAALRGLSDLACSLSDDVREGALLPSAPRARKTWEQHHEALKTHYPGTLLIRIHRLAQEGGRIGDVASGVLDALLWAEQDWLARRGPTVTREAYSGGFAERAQGRRDWQPPAAA